MYNLTVGLQNKIRLFRIFAFVHSLNFYLPIQLIYFYFATQSYSLAAALAAIIIVCSALSEIPTGIFSDIVGRKQTHILATVLNAVSLGFYAIGFHNLWFLVIGALIEGVSTALYNGNTQAYLHNILSENNLENQYHHYYGSVNAVATIASFIAALFCGFLASKTLPLLMWASVVPQVIAIFIAFSMPAVRTVNSNTLVGLWSHLKGVIKEIRGNVNLQLLSISKILGNGAGLTAYQFQALVITAFWPLWAVGIARALQEVINVPGFYIAGKIIKKFGEIKVLIFGTEQSVLSNIIAAVFPSVLSPIFIASSGFLYGPSDTAEQTLFQKEFSDKQRATIASFNSFVGSLYFAAVSISVGIFANHFGPVSALLLTQLLFVPTIVLQWVLFKRLKKHSPEATSIS